LLRSAPPCLKAALMIARVAGETIAPPKPWMARKTISARPLLDQRAGERSECEDHHADHEDTAPAEDVGSAAAEQQEPAEGE
jgi:hypothetical protein